MGFKAFLKKARNTIQGKIILLDYPWKPVSRYQQNLPINQHIQSNLEQNFDNYKRYIPSVLTYLDTFKSIPVALPGESHSVYWKNNYLPGLDLVFLYTLVREQKPAKIIEIGSGHSTAVMRRAIQDGQLSTQITCIDPQPRRKLSQLADVVLPMALENLTGFQIFNQLKPGDILFFDGSHLALPNSDVTVFFMEILPRLAPGVFIQIHDIYLPFDYPEDMVSRGYNEQYVLAQLLQFGWPGKMEVLFPAYWMSRQEIFQNEMDAGLWQYLPAQIEKHGGSFWFTINP